MSIKSFGDFDPTPKVQGVQASVFLAADLDLNRLAARVGTYQVGMGSASHEVFDLPTKYLRPFIRDQIPDTVASDKDFTVVRLYVPMNLHGQIDDIGLINGLFAAPMHPWVSMSGSSPMYCAPADEAKYKSRCQPTRLPKGQRPVEQPLGDKGWVPKDGDRFHIVEL